MNKSIVYQKTQIEYEINGTGAVVVLLHGFTESKKIWKIFVEKLSLNHCVVTPDLPAHGRSGFPKHGLTMEFMAECLYAILSAEKINKATFFGHSMGGYAMLAFAEKYPQLCKGICLFHSNARADTPEAKINRDRAKEIILQNRTGFLNSFIPDLFAISNREKLQTEIDALIREASSMSPEGLAACMDAMKERQGSIELLALANFPIGFIIGKQDNRIPFETVLAQTALPKQSHVLILDDCGHMGYLEKPKETLKFFEYFAGLG